jgi:archaellum component FlaC
MGKISKYSNLYDKDGNFLHKSGNYSIEELEELIDMLDKNSKEFANATAILMHMYEQKGNPHRDELIQKLIEQSKTKTTKAEVVNTLNDIKDEETREDGSGTEGCVSDTAEGTGELGRGSDSNETDTTISTAA